MKNRIIDWIVPILQTFLPLLVIPLVLCLNVKQIIIDVLSQSGVCYSELPVGYRLIIGFGKAAIIIAVLLLACKLIRKRNKETTLKQNIPNASVWHSYAGYWFCRYLLNYRNISLTRVPIPVQCKLVWTGIFKTYEFLDGVSELDLGKDKVQVRCKQSTSFTDTINLVLMDTYPLDWKYALPDHSKKQTTIIIDRFKEKGVRYYSHEFISKIAETIHGLPDNVKNIYLFGTINSAHVYHIINDVFKTGGRDVKRHLRVYQQSSETWKFDGRYLDIF